MRLELGAGYRPKEGWIHQDALALPHIEIVGDAAKICSHPEVGPSSCTAIRAAHLLEHFSWRKTTTVLKEWHQALCPGGKLEIDVPNFLWQVTQAIAKGHSEEEVV